MKILLGKHFICLFILLLVHRFVSPVSAGDASFADEIKPLLDTYCFKCHGTGKRIKGDVDLTEYPDVTSIHKDPKTWETVLRQMEDGEMPPEDKPQPSIEERDLLTSWIAGILENLDSDVLPKDPGRVVIHRLSRTEYNNTIRDLLGVDSRPADKFPSEGGGGGGFDNNADTLFVPPILLERYLDAAGQVLSEANPDKVFLVRPSKDVSAEQAAQSILEHFVPRAFRRPANNGEINRLLGLFHKATDQGQPFEDAIRLSLKGILVSPNFLFRVEIDQETDKPYRVSDFELATRLSYFLWSSMPDDKLFELAGQNRLHEPEILDAQVIRMLKDPKAKALAEKFAGQWLGVDNLRTVAQPDPNRFPEYSVELQQLLYREPIDYFMHLLRENRSVLELLDANYTFLNEALAKHYGVPGVKGSEMRLVTLTNRNRGGVLSMGGVLTLTSYPRRTSPVLRGKWVLEEILGTPPPPPPPLVSSLSRDDRARGGLSFRQQLEKHREDPNCVGCHEKMDPLGFALENFDAIGRWRTTVSKQPVDASGQLPSGETFTGPVELKQTLLAKKDLFTRNLAEKMLAYALGRGLEYYDVATVRALVAALEEDDYRSQTLLRQVVASFPFQYRRNDPR